MSNPLEMSDDEFLKMNPPSGGSTAVVEEQPKQEETQTETVIEGEVIPPSGSSEENPPVQEEEQKQEETTDAAVNTDDKSTETSGDKAVQTSETEKKETTAKTEAKPADGAKKEEAPKTEEQEPPNYEAFYNQIMKPFKANGKTVELKTPDEAIKLMQMGANYTKRMQDLVPHRKVLTMLQNNNLLDENQLSYLIDLSKHNPDAIKKLVKDSGVDPLDINTSEETAYKPNNHKVTDVEVAFHSKLADIQSQPTGTETLQIINKTWDDISKDALWESPEILDHIQTQRDNGIYDQIVAEIDRQRMLGGLQNKPFIAAYKQVGEEMMAKNAFVLKQTNEPTPTPVVVTTRTVAPKPAVDNNDKARAASPTKTTPAKAKVLVNPLAMDDDEFLKSMSNRL